MRLEPAALYDLYARYGALLDAERYDDWLSLFAAECSYQVVPRENFLAGLPAALIFCDTRAMLEDRISALRQANKFNIHNEAPFAVYQTDQEGETRLFATGLYRDRLTVEDGALRFRDKLVLLDSFAVPSLLATPL